MAAHTEKQFKTFMSQLKETNVTLDFFSDFAKISKNVEETAINLNTLNYLLGKKDLRPAVEALWRKDKSVFEAMDILIATREQEGRLFLDKSGQCRKVHSLFDSVDGVMDFLEGTGLAEVFKERKIKNLEDYVFGVETGLDTNARKNRSGAVTEKLVEEAFKEAGIKYERQVASSLYPEVEAALGSDRKVFDFAVSTKGMTYLIEVNFYSGIGSKLNEVARSYTEIAPKVNGVDGYEFVWITDGVGWKLAENKLREAFNVIPDVYNFATIGDFINKVKTETSTANNDNDKENSKPVQTEA